MSSVIYTKRCPQCGGWYRVEENSSTGEFFAHCERCGRVDEMSYHHKSPDKPVAHESYQNGYGCIAIAKSNNSGWTEFLVNPITEEKKAEFLSEIENDPNIIKEQCYFTIWDEDKRDVVSFYGEVPPLFPETDAEKVLRLEKEKAHNECAASLSSVAAERVKCYDTYEYGSGIDGNTIKLTRSVYLSSEADITDLVTMSTDDLEMLLKENKEKEASIWEKIDAWANEWSFFAARRLMLQEAIKMKAIRPVVHTNNVWERSRDGDEYISNMVYHMSIRVWEDRTWVVETHEQKTNAWFVTWDLWFNTPHRGARNHIAGVNRKKFTDYEAMLKYIAGRKKAYAKYFAEISPAIPKDKTKLFSVCGALLPGYTIEEDKT